MADQTVVTLRAHFDGERIHLDEPYALRPGAKLLVAVLSVAEPDDREAWQALSARRLEDAYGEHEPDYPSDLIRERNPDYEGR
jgi:hypothetical protein